MYNDKLILKSNLFISTIAEINKLWEDIYIKHKKEVKELIIDGFKLHIDFYNYMKGLNVVSKKNINDLEQIELEIIIATKKKIIDIKRSEYIHNHAISLKESTKERHDENNKILLGINNNKKEINDKKIKLEEDTTMNRIKTAGGGVIGGTTAGATCAGTFMRGVSIGTGGALTIGVIVGASILLAAAEVISLVNRKNFEALEKILNKLMEKMEDLEKLSQEISELTKDTVDKLEAYVGISEKFANIDNLKDVDAFETYIDKLSKTNKSLLDCFTSINEKTNINIKHLGQLIYKNDPNILITFYNNKN